MLSHDNFTWDAETIAEYMEVRKTGEVIVSFLPLSHVAAQVTIPFSTQNTYLLSDLPRMSTKTNIQKRSCIFC
jgi:long-chain-fatty-acid--CoA ligase ACSBG